MQALQGQWAGWCTKVARPIPEEGSLQILWDGALHLLNPVVEFARLRGKGRCPVLRIEGRHWGALHNGISLHMSKAQMSELRCAWPGIWRSPPACMAACGGACPP